MGCGLWIMGCCVVVLWVTEFGTLTLNKDQEPKTKNLHILWIMGGCVMGLGFWNFDLK